MSLYEKYYLQEWNSKEHAKTINVYLILLFALHSGHILKLLLELPRSFLNKTKFYMNFC